MKKIIAEVFQAEDKVDAVLKEARQRAADIRRQAESDASETVAEARRQAREIRQTSVEKAREQAELLRKEKLEQAQRDEDALLESSEGSTEGLVEEICRIVLEAEYEE